MKTFEEKALEGIESLGEKIDEQATEVKAVRSKQDTLVENYAQLDKDTKKAFEDLTALKKTANQNSADFQKFELKIKEIQGRLRWEQRQAFGDPVKRIQADEELRFRFNAAIRLAVNLNGDMQRITADFRQTAVVCE